MRGIEYIFTPQNPERFLQLEENMIKEVLRELLKREPTLEDAKELVRIQKQGEPDKCYLAYKNINFGAVYLNAKLEGGLMSIEFVPYGRKEFLEPATNSDGTKVEF